MSEESTEQKITESSAAPIKKSRKKKKIIIILVIVAIIIIAGFLYLNFVNSQKQDKVIYKLNGDTLYYSKNRGKVDYVKSLRYENDTYSVYNINFLSRPFMKKQTRIYGYLYMPKDKTNVPGIVVVPGGGVTKDDFVGPSIKFTELGYAVLVIDQRGLGQTKGLYLNIKDDYMVFMKGDEPINHLSVYDVLRSFDVISEIPNVDKNNIAIYAESMGARYGIIATALDDRIKGIIAVSTSGFNVAKDDNSNATNYLLSIDPDHYIGKISPREVIMMHGTNDTVVNINDSKRTYGLAKEPKGYFIGDGCGHGYCEKLFEDIKASFKKIFGK